MKFKFLNQWKPSYTPWRTWVFILFGYCKSKITCDTQQICVTIFNFSVYWDYNIRRESK